MIERQSIKKAFLEQKKREGKIKNPLSL